MGLSVFSSWGWRNQTPGDCANLASKGIKKKISSDDKKEVGWIPWNTYSHAMTDLAMDKASCNEKQSCLHAMDLDSGLQTASPGGNGALY